MNCADALVKCLEAEGVEYVFGYPGVAITPFYNSILQTDIHTVLIRQEQSAAHAASGYARISGKVGVAVVTSGPGATNLITGIATAFADSIPLVCITGQVDSQMMGSDVFQEADISGACESFVKYSYIVRNAADIPRIIKEAFYIANTGRRGPVLIVHGDEDEAVPYRCAVELEKEYENAKLVTIPGDDHCYDYHLDQVLEAVTSFVKDCESGR